MSGGTQIGIRRLLLRGADGSVHRIRARIGTPRRIGPKEWRCDFDVIGPNGTVVLHNADGTELSVTGKQSALGIDEIDALQNALLGLRIALDAFGEQVSWLNEPGWHGIRKSITGFTIIMERRLVKLVNDEVDAICNGLEDEATRPAMLKLIRGPNFNWRKGLRRQVKVDRNVDST